MSEYIQNENPRPEDLISYAKRMLKGERGVDLYEVYKDIIPEVSPQDVIAIVDELVKTGEGTYRIVGGHCDTDYRPAVRDIEDYHFKRLWRERGQSIFRSRPPGKGEKWGLRLALKGRMKDLLELELTANDRP